jgi:hypothetical protein
MLHTRRRIKQDYLIWKEPHVTEDGGKERILGAETPATSLADATHHEKPEVFCYGDREPIDNITYIRVKCKESTGGYSRSGTGFLSQVVSTLRDGDYPIRILRQNTHGHREVPLGITVNSKNPGPFLCEQVGEKGGDCGLTDPAFPGNYYPDSLPDQMRVMVISC